MTEFEKREIERKKKISFLNENLGIEILDLLKDEETLEISLNQDGYIWLEKMGTGYKRTEIQLNTLRGKTIIEVVASYDDKNVNRDNPIVSTTLPDGERFEGLLYDPVGFNPVFSIRKPNSRIILLEEHERNGILTKEQRKFLEQAILNKKNILVVGGTSSGKTTFINSCLQVLSNSDDRIIVLEDTRELVCNTKNKIMLKTTENISMIDLTRSSMRLNPDRMILGELRRGSETIELLKGWNSGHSGGLTSIHANSCQAGLFKLEQYLAEVSEREQRDLILEAINIVVNLVKENNYRKIKEIALVKGFDRNNGKYILEKVL